jgi:hypothetical protein
VVKIIVESLSQHDEKYVVPTPLSRIRVGKRRNLKAGSYQLLKCIATQTLIWILFLIRDSEQHHIQIKQLKPNLFKTLS